LSVQLILFFLNHALIFKTHPGRPDVKELCFGVVT